LLDDSLERERGERRERQKGERRERQREERRERQKGERRKRQREERRERQKGERREMQRGQRRERQRGEMKERLKERRWGVNLGCLSVVLWERKLFGKHRCRRARRKYTLERQLGYSCCNKRASYIYWKHECLQSFQHSEHCS
jgi:hypothetical protein